MSEYVSRYFKWEEVKGHSDIIFKGCVRISVGERWDYTVGVVIINDTYGYKAIMSFNPCYLHTEKIEFIYKDGIDSIEYCVDDFIDQVIINMWHRVSTISKKTYGCYYSLEQVLKDSGVVPHLALESVPEQHNPIKWAMKDFEEPKANETKGE